MRPIADSVVFLVALEIDPLPDHFLPENIPGGQEGMVGFESA
jgi:hypothetical protein